MNIEDINVGDILVHSSIVGDYEELVMVISTFKSGRPQWKDTTVCKVRAISSTREHRIGKTKQFTQKTLNNRRFLRRLT